ncbi:MAG: hypothetical protein SV186_06360 [Candidatus Nanohaloarchaea archaeon]|nr:hypothetical protein [Candidatus Nanohaloarchaea archaeon]
MMLSLLLNTFSLLFASINIFMVIKIFSEVTPVAEAPQAWTMLALGIGMIVIHLSLNMFVWISPVFRVYDIRVISAVVGVVGFASLFLGVRQLYEVVAV